MSQPSIDVRSLWAYVTEQVKGLTTLPALWRAMEAAHPIVVEEDQFVVGFSGADAHQAGLLLDTRHRNMIEQVIEAATRRKLRLRVISGETLQDWEITKEQEREAKRLQELHRQQYLRQVEAGQTWDAVGEQLVRKFAQLPNKGLASVQGSYLAECVEVLAEAWGRLMPAEPSEADERSYSRVLERVAERAMVPSPLIAYLVQARRQARGPGASSG